MAIKLNSKSPRPAITEQLINMGLSYNQEYSVHWSEVIKGEWDLKERSSKKVVLTLKPWKLDQLVRNNILLSANFLSK